MSKAASGFIQLRGATSAGGDGVPAALAVVFPAADAAMAAPLATAANDCAPTRGEGIFVEVPFFVLVADAGCSPAAALFGR